MTALSPLTDIRDKRGHEPRPVSGKTGLQAVYLRFSVVPATFLAVLSVTGMAYALAAPHNPDTMRVIVTVITCCVLLMLVASVAGATASDRWVTGQLGSALTQAQRIQAEVRQLAERARRGQPAASTEPAPVPVRAAGDDLFRSLAHELEQASYTAEQAIAGLGERGEHRVEIFVNLARRMQSLVHREIEMLDDLEAQVEDPDLLKGLFTIDHLATRMRRQSESLAVLGGSSSRRQWTRQVKMHEVLRASVAEVEQYSRVKIVPPAEGVLRGSAVADVIHLIAELVENATKFSPPRTNAMIRAQQVTAGVAIEIEDRGLGMVADDLDRMNRLLAGPAQIGLDELLADGRIGLYVVSTLAGRHGIQVRLQSNIFGGTSAVVVLPRRILEDPASRELPGAAASPAVSDAAEASEPGSQPVLAGVPGPAPDSADGLTVRRVPGAQLPPHLDRPPSVTRPDMGLMPPAPAESPAPDAQQAPARSAQTGSQSGASGASGAERPPLPQRQAQATLSAQLGEDAGQTPASAGGSFQAIPGAASAEPADQMPGLMGDFLRGVHSADGTGEDGTRSQT